MWKRRWLPAQVGVGRATAISLAKEDLVVFAIGRTIASADLLDNVVRIPCDHMNDDETAAAFVRIEKDAGRLDIMVNSTWGE